MGRKLIAALVAAVIGGSAIVTLAMAQASTPRSEATRGYEPVLDPGNFVRVIDNPYYPLPVGRVLTYKGVRDGVRQIERVIVTHGTRVLEGVRATAVRDVARRASNGALLEKTTDWYAQDRQGNVWYLGEKTAAYDPDGTVDTSGSWLAGVDDAEPGIIMEAHPAVPDAYRQEYLQGEAEDTAWIVRVGGHVDIPFGHVEHLLTSLEATVVEPGSYDQKIYARGLGIVVEHALTSQEDSVLVRVRN
jgi:hypothetical protein